jgi:hypothetical protein
MRIRAINTFFLDLTGYTDCHFQVILLFHTIHFTNYIKYYLVSILQTSFLMLLILTIIYFKFSS